MFTVSLQHFCTHWYVREEDSVNDSGNEFSISDGLIPGNVIGHRCRSLCLERVWNINAWDPWPPAPRSGRVWGTRWAQLTSSDLRSLEHATTLLSYFKTSLRAINIELVFDWGGISNKWDTAKDTRASVKHVHFSERLHRKTLAHMKKHYSHL